MSTKLAHFTLLSKLQSDHHDEIGWKTRNSIYSDKSERSHYLPEQCRPIGFAHWFYMAKTLPSIIHRIQSIELAKEALQLVEDNLIAFDNKNKTNDSRKSLDVYSRNNFKFNEIQYIEENEENNPKIPLLTTFLEAITPKMSLENFDSERFSY